MIRGKKMADQPSEEQGIEKEKSSEEISDDMEQGKKEEDVYTKEGREKLVEDAEISPAEEGFAEGQEDVECERCHQITSVEDATVKTINDQKHYFCSEECAKE